MTKQLEQELTAWMRRQADRSVHGADLAPGAFRKVRRIRRQRRIAVVAVAAAAIGIVVPAGAQVMNRATGPDQVVNTPTTSVEPEPTPSRTPAPTPRGARSIVLDFGKLSRGTTNVPRWDAEKSALRWGEDSLPLGQNGRPELFAPLRFEGATRYAVFSTTSEVGGRLDLVGGEAEQPLTDDAGTFAVSADGEQVAYTTGKDRGVSVASGSGRVLHSRTFDVAPKVVGFVGNTVVVSSADSGEHPRVQVWDLDSDQVRTIEGARSAESTAPDKGLVAVLTGNPANTDELCFSVIDVDNGDRPIWQGGCGMELAELSPDGRHIVLGPPVGGEVTPVRYDFVDLATKRTVLKVRADSWNGLTWEPDGTHIVLNAFVGDDNALVRCGLSGDCELVSTPLSWESQKYYELPVS